MKKGFKEKLGNVGVAYLYRMTVVESRNTTYPVEPYLVKEFLKKPIPEGKKRAFIAPILTPKA